MAGTTETLGYLEWQALLILYRNRERVSSPLKYVGLPNTVNGLIQHHPPLAVWVGKSSERQLHITAQGIAFCETGS
jgi:hypothetical protein